MLRGAADYPWYYGTALEEQLEKILFSLYNAYPMFTIEINGLLGQHKC